eukprot:TRINITY_DN14086_c0_g1_i1.p1 TRINITY_DN14086_c0_g1~~TRINITY_DN14086_c0_g1_i1.p1  ORF type:complete len:663 (-),score=212.62 TRINITY_DN14086_c0_g1_i1:22-2010(-)
MFRVLCLGAVVQAFGLSFDLRDPKERPTTKVVYLLKDIQKDLESEAAADLETFEKFKCWCTENAEGKAKAIELAQRGTKENEELVSQLISKAERLQAEIESTEDELQKNRAALDTATALRKQQNAEFLSDEERLSADITAVEDAITVMVGSGNQVAFLQANKFNAVKPMLAAILDKHSDRISSNDHELVLDFLQSERGNGVETVLGVLNGLKDDFDADLNRVVDTEKKAVKEYKYLSEAKQEEIETNIRQIEKNKEERADADEDRAQAKKEIKDLQAQIGADSEFAEEVKMQCADMDKQWEERKVLRADEMKAMSKAIDTLDSEEAQDNFAKSISFLQESQHPEGSKVLRQRAAETLASAGMYDQRLVTLAMQTKIDKFTKVKKAMDEMVASVKQQIEDEVQQKDFCVKSFNENQIQTESKTRDRDDLQAAQNAIDLKTPSDKVQLLQDEVAELKKQLKLASLNRKQENVEFQKFIPEVRETQRLLKLALEELGKFYNRQPATAFVQHFGETNPKAPAGFKDYKANGQSFGVMSMIQQLISETKASEKLSEREEASAQKAYDKFATETTSSVQMKEKAIANTKAAKAKLEKKLVQIRKAKEAVQYELDVLASTEENLHGSCDFLLTSFDFRQAAMKEEIESVNKAKAILSGASFAEIQLYGR